MFKMRFTLGKYIKIVYISQSEFLKIRIEINNAAVEVETQRFVFMLAS